MVKPQDKPAKVSRADDEILIDGPDGMTASLTPDAALKTAEALENKAVEAIVARDAEEHAPPPDDLPRRD